MGVRGGGRRSGGGGCARAGGSVFSWAVDRVDDEDLDGVFGGDELEAELFLESYGERGSVGGSCGGGGIAPGGPGEVGEVEVAGEAAVVDDGTVAGVAADDAGEQLHLDGACVEDAQAGVVEHGPHRAGRQRIAGAHLEWRIAGFALGRRGDFGDL